MINHISERIAKALGIYVDKTTEVKPPVKR